MPTPAKKKSPAKKPAPPKRRAATKDAPTAREAERARKRLAAASAELKEAKGMVRGVTKLQAKYARQLKAVNAGLKVLQGKERALEKEVAALKKAGAGRAPRRAAKAA